MRRDKERLSYSPGAMDAAKWLAATLASAAIGVYVGPENLWAVILAAVGIAASLWAMGTRPVQDRVPLLRSRENRLLLTYLAGRDLYTSLKTEQRSGEPLWKEWQPWIYAWEDQLVDTLHRTVRLRADAILRRLQSAEIQPGPNWAVVARRSLNERLTELERLLDEFG